MAGPWSSAASNQMETALRPLKSDPAASVQTGERSHQAGRHQPAQHGAQFRQAAIQQLAAEQPEVEEHEQAAESGGETAEHHR